MKEEHVTCAIINFLKKEKWSILCYDFPQSGTGMSFGVDPFQKNKGKLNPDILAFKHDTILWFENKGYFSKSDFDKCAKIKGDELLQSCIRNRFQLNGDVAIKVGCGLPLIASSRDFSLQIALVDFIIFVNEQKECVVGYGEIASLRT